MRTEKLNYDLPAELIAQFPAEKRGLSRLLVLNRKDNSLTDTQFCKIDEYLKKGDCLVINETKVLPAKFFAKRKTGAKLEGLFIETDKNQLWLVMLKNANRVKENEKLELLDKQQKCHCSVNVEKKLGKGKWLLKAENNPEQILGQIGYSPLPPYIKRDEPESHHEFDKERYQTIYAAKTGAVAAPTAGMHFTEKIFDRLKAKGIQIARLTLHVGIGTFKPVTAENLEKHEIHYEKYEIDEKNAKIINDTTANKGRVIAVGTTSVRTLETIACPKKVKASAGETNLFIMPGYKFKIVDAIITNFHLPKSTLIALIAAFAGLENVMTAYKHAIENKYRFYSYGDAMLII